MKEETLAALLDEQYSITELPEIDPGSLINLSGFQYKIIEPIFELNIIPDGFYYKAIGEDSKNYIIKFSFKYKNPAYEPKPSVHTLLTSLSHEGLAKSKEFATGIKKYKFKYCYEVYEVDTDIVPLMFVDVAASAVKHSLLPQLKDLIEYLHKNDVFLPYLHICNLFVKPGEKPKIILLGYGHAMSKSKFPVVEKSSFSESNLCRFFLAPEVMEGLYSTTSDYYSLGMILLWIFYPDTFSKKNFTAILQNSKELKPIIEYKPELYEVNLLIEGLTLHEELNRFTAAQLNDIMAGKQVLPLYYGEFYLVKHPKGNEKLHNIGDLVVFIQSQPDKFKKHLSHPADLQAFTEWVSSLDGVKNSASLKGYLIRYKNYPVDFLSEIILRVLIPGRPLKIGGNEYSLTEPSEYKETASDFFRHLEHVHFYDKGASLDFELYRFLLACRELYNSDTKKYPVLNDTFNRALEILELEPDVFDEEFAKKTINITQKKWAFLFHAFIQNKFFRAFEGTKISKIEDFSFYLAQHPEVISDEYHYYDMVKFLEAHGITEVKGKTYKDIVFEILYKRAECEIQVAKIDELKPGSYKMYYTQRLSLTSYFKSLGEELPFATDIKHQYSFEFKKVGLRTSNKVYTQFLKHLQEKHSIPVEKIPHSVESQIKERLKDLLDGGFKPKTLIVNFVLVVVLGYLFSAFAFDQIVDDTTQWYLSLMPELQFVIVNVLPYLVLALILLMLLFLSQNLKKTALFLMVFMLLTLGATWLIYQHGAGEIDDSIAKKKAILSELYKGSVADKSTMKVKADELISNFDIAVGKSNPDFQPLVKLFNNDSLFVLQSSIRPYWRTIRTLEDGTYAAKFEPVTEKDNPTKFVATFPLPSSAGMMNLDQFFSFKVAIDDLTVNLDSGGVFGIAFNHYFILFSGKSVKFISKSLPESSGKDQIILVTELKNFDYEIEASGPSADVEPGGIVAKVDTDSLITENALNSGLDRVKLEIIVLFSTVSVRVNGTDVLHYKKAKGFADIDFDNFDQGLSMVYGLNTDVSFRGLEITAITDPTNEKSLLAKKDLKCKLKGGYRLFSDSKLQNPVKQKPAEKTSYTALELVGETLKISNPSGQIFFVKKRDVDDILF